MLAAPDKAQKIVVHIKIAGQIAFGKLLTQFHFIQTEQQIIGKVSDEFSVLAPCWNT